MPPTRGDIALIPSATRDELRPLSLVLASRGVKLVVTGPDERILGELVGEIVFGGGQARHVAGPPDPPTLALAWEKATVSFGLPTHVVAAPDDAAAAAFATERSVALLVVDPSVVDVPSALRFLEGA